MSMAVSQISFLFKVWLEGQRVGLRIHLLSFTVDLSPPTSMTETQSRHGEHSHISLS